MNKTLVVILVAVLLIVGAGTAFIVGNRDKNNDTTEQTTNVQDAPQTSPAPDSTPAESSAEPTEQTNNSTSVTIKNFAFSPNAITVKKGTTVTWTNEDSAEHNAFSDQDGGPKGRLLSKGESYSFTFDKVGTFNYICTPHPHMKGTVTVTD